MRRALLILPSSAGAALWRAKYPVGEKLVLKKDLRISKLLKSAILFSPLSIKELPLLSQLRARSPDLVAVGGQAP